MSLCIKYTGRKWCYSDIRSLCRADENNWNTGPPGAAWNSVNMREVVTAGEGGEGGEHEEGSSDRGREGGGRGVEKP